ncbi:MAG: hypothetical protein PF542_06865 [Nanoarchaeota archaeon]|jgi:hypothetical protein|nr:hypothetical protein [Nanoarchaeota archaeon]
MNDDELLRRRFNSLSRGEYCRNNNVTPLSSDFFDSSFSEGYYNRLPNQLEYGIGGYKPVEFPIFELAKVRLPKIEPFKLPVRKPIELPEIKPIKLEKIEPIDLSPNIGRNLLDL